MAAISLCLGVSSAKRGTMPRMSAYNCRVASESSPGALQVVGGLHQRQHLDRGDLVAVLHDLPRSIAALVPCRRCPVVVVVGQFEWTYIGLESVCDSAVVEVAVNCAACNP